MIFYFSATGNSKYLAEVLAEKTRDVTVDIAAHIKADTTPLFSSETPLVFVAPVYAWRLPRVLERWIRACKFEGNKQAYFVISCGESIGAAEKYVRKFAAAVGFTYMGTAEVVMPENYIIMFSAPRAEEDAEMIARATEQVCAIADKIGAATLLSSVKSNCKGHLCSTLVNPMFYTFYIGAKKFYATDACISCGKCAVVCMQNNIILQDGKPKWGRDCIHCMACISRCPTEAIEYGKNTKGKRRYVFSGGKEK